MALQTPHDPSSDESKRRQQSEYVRYSTMGIEFAITIGVFGFGGWWLDGLLGLRDSFPVFLLVGVFLGMGLGIYRMTRNLDGLAKRSRSESSDHDSQS